MENFGLLKFLKSPYPAGRETPPGPPPGNALKNPSGNGEKTPENAEKNVENKVKTPEIQSKTAKFTSILWKNNAI